MQIEQNGWVVINIGHPRTGTNYIVGETFSTYRKNAIKKFIDGSGNTWKYWKEKYNFRVVKSKQTVSTSINHENGNDANRLLYAVASEEFVEDFTADGELTPIDIVSEITGLTYDEIRSRSKIVRVP